MKSKSVFTSVFGRMMPSSSTMLLFIVFLQLINALKADFSVKCVNESISRTVFKPSADGVLGRYDVEWCTEGSAKVTQWNLVLSYTMFRNQSNCLIKPPTSHKHSELYMFFENGDVNCTHMCFYTYLDMIFNGCFILENNLPAMGSKRDFLARYVNNSVPLRSYTENIIYADALNHEDHVDVHWYLDKVTATTFDMRLCENRTDAAGERKVIQDQVYVALPKDDICQEVTNNCTVLPQRNEILCTLWHLTGSTYYMELQNSGNWKNCNALSSQLYKLYTFNVTDGRVPLSAPAPPPASPALAWACGAVLVLCAVAGGAWFVWRSRLTRRFQQRVHTHWTCGDKPGIEPIAMPPENATRAVLLLYAREGDQGEPLIRAITDLLVQSQIKVLDLYSPQVVSYSAGAPAGWLRDTLRRDHTRVLLLQTPTLAAIYGDRTCPLEPGAEAALLHRSVTAVPAEPAPGDALLSLALRLLAEDVHTPTPYNKYFLATLESLETETLPHTVPFRRYALPGDAARLVLDVQLGTALPSSDSLQVLRHEANAFVQHVRDRPGYLKDHLLLLD